MCGLAVPAPGAPAGSWRGPLGVPGGRRGAEQAGMRWAAAGRSCQAEQRCGHAGKQG